MAQRIPAAFMEALEHMRAEDVPMGDRLGGEREIAHRRELASYVDKMFEDSVLTQASWLLAFPSSILGRVEGVSPAVRALVAAAQRLAGSSDDDRVVKTLAQTSGLRAVLLLTLDTVQRLDPSGALRAWTQRFPIRPDRYLDQDALSLGPTVVDLAERVLIPAVDVHGFWLEGQVLRNAVLIARDPTRFDSLLEFVLQAHHSDWGRLTHRRTIELALGIDPHRESHPTDHNTEPRCRWQWRSVGTISEQLASIGHSSEWRRALYLCGAVTVTCGDAPHCYQVLGELHASLPYRRLGVHDYLGLPSQSGYRCIRTVVAIPGPDGSSTSMSVRIMPRHPDFDAYSFVGKQRLGSIRDAKDAVPQERIRVFTPAGEARDLDPVDARVLAFAASIHEDLVALATSARLNHDENVDLLHPLRDGDEVELLLGRRPRPLPEGWQEHFTDATRGHIQRSHRRAWRTAIAAEGRRLLRMELDLADADARTLGVLVQQGLSSLEEERAGLPQHGVDWWFEQLGLLRGRLTVPEGISQVRIELEVAEALVAHVDRICERILKVHRSAELFMPRETLGRARSVRFCSGCKPGRDNTLVGTLQADGNSIELVLHRDGEPCGEGGTPMGLQDRFSFDQVFLVETGNQPGTAQAVLAVFSESGIDLVEVVARRLGPNWGAFRIEVAPIGPGLARILKRRLQDLTDVYDVRGPEDGGSPILEAAMPPRQSTPTTPLHFPSPFTCGPEAEDDHQFYGRESELGELFAQYRKCRERGSIGGRMVFLNGPLRIGKSSIGRRFCLLLRRNPQLKAITSLLKARFDEPWSAFRQRMATQLAQDAMKAPLDRRTRPGELRHSADLDTLIGELCGSDASPTVVLVVDEVHRMMRTSDTQKVDDVEAILHFRELVEATPGLMVVWVCPTAATRQLNPKLSAMLHRGAQALPVGPFTLDETTALLSGENIGFLRTIHLQPKLARHLHKLTGGEPLWLSHLGQAMWLRAARMNSRNVRFEFSQLHQVKQALLNNSDLFDVRIDPDNPEAHDSVVWRTAFELAKAHRSGTRPHSNLTLDQIANRVGDPGSPTLREQQRIVLELLQDRGAARPVSSEPVRWQIAVPLLAEYLNRLRPQGR